MLIFEMITMPITNDKEMQQVNEHSLNRTKFNL